MANFESLLPMRLDNPARRIILLLGVCVLIFLTVMASLPINVIGPFNARTYEPVDCVKVEYSPAGAAIEPVMAIAHIVAGAPDMRVAAISVPLWIVGLAACVAAVVQLRRNRWRANWRTITGIFATTYKALLITVVYGMFAILIRIPNWQAVAQDPNIILVELHTHTFGSFDGLISASDCLRWHHQRGCSVVAVTDHDSLKGGLEAAALAEKDESLPGVIPGVELNLEQLNAVIAIGSKEQLANPKFETSSLQFQRHHGSFISWFHQNCHGVVLALRYRLSVERVKKLVEAGIDGFDIASDGHPYVSPDLQAEVLAAGNAHQLPFVAWTDWHGYSGILRTWTAIRIPKTAQLSRQQRTAAVLDILSRHECSEITPLVVGRIGQASLSRIIFAPFAESIRYALGLSPLRVLAYWFWGIAMFLTVTCLLHFGISPGQMIGAAATAAMGLLVLIRGIQLIMAHFSGQAPFSYPLWFGSAAMMLGITAVISGAIYGWFTIKYRRQIIGKKPS